MFILVYLFICRMTQLPNFLHVHESQLPNFLYVHEFVLLIIFPTLNMLAYTKKYSKILIFECLLNNYITDKSQPIYIFIIVLHFSNSKVSSKLYCRFRKSPFFFKWIVLFNTSHMIQKICNKMLGLWNKQHLQTDCSGKQQVHLSSR